MTVTIADLGEQGLLALLQSYGDSEVIGDDAAVLDLLPGHSLVVTTDVLVEGVHFSDRTTPPHSVGWRAAAANLSDLAAMGASGLGITVALSLPPDCPVDWVESVYQGLQDCLQPYGLAIVGGDVSRSATRSLAITALGQVLPEHRIQRHTACPGDDIVVTGAHGGAKAGLELLLQAEQYRKLDTEDYEQLVHLHRYPCPRLDCLPALNQLSVLDLQGQPPQIQQPQGRLSGMDSSDGLADAVLQLCRASGVGAVIDAEKIPVVDALKRWRSPQQFLEWSLYGGEDFELVLCMAPELSQHFCQTISTATVIGRTTTNPSVYLTLPPDWSTSHLAGESVDGSLPSCLELTLNQGFQHFSSKADMTGA